MSAVIKSLDISRLTVEERLTLIGELWDSLDVNDVPLTDAQREELDRRLAEDEANPDDGVPWEEVKAAALARLKR